MWYFTLSKCSSLHTSRKNNHEENSALVAIYLPVFMMQVAQLRQTALASLTPMMMWLSCHPITAQKMAILSQQCASVSLAYTAWGVPSVMGWVEIPLPRPGLTRWYAVVRSGCPECILRRSCRIFRVIPVRVGSPSRHRLYRIHIALDRIIWLFWLIATCLTRVGSHLIRSWSLVSQQSDYAWWRTSTKSCSKVCVVGLLTWSVWEGW